MGRFSRRRKEESNRLIDTWEINVNGNIEKVEIRYIAKHQAPSKSDEISGENQFQFMAITKTFRLTNTDIKKLRKDVEKKLNETYKIEWIKKLHIELASDISEFSDEDLREFTGSVMPWEAKIEISIQPYEVAKSAYGQELIRTGEGQAPSYNWPEQGEDIGDGWNKKDISTMIDDTLENRAALAELFAGYRRLHGILCKLLHPKKAQGFLANMKFDKLLTTSNKDE